MNKRRLETLAKFLWKVPPENFRMAQWFVGKGNPVVMLREHLNNPHKCGTAACALGWACIIPEFAEAGLRFSDGPHKIPIYRDLSNYAAGAKFFGITEGQSENLFYSGRYRGPSDSITPKMVSRRIRALIRNHG